MATPGVAHPAAETADQPGGRAASPARAPAGECLRLTLRGFSPDELQARARRECACHFGECDWKFERAEFVPCIGSLGGRVRLYEARFVATA